MIGNIKSIAPADPPTTPPTIAPVLAPVLFPSSPSSSLFGVSVE